MIVRYACCEHCHEDEVHHLRPNTHLAWCSIETCSKGKKAVSSDAGQQKEEQ